MRGQVAVSAASGNATGLQIPGVLDDLYDNDEDLGPVYDGGSPSLSVWAPTAKSVKLHLYDGPNGEASNVREMSLDRETGVWSASGGSNWDRKFYRYEVEVYSPETGEVERNMVTDPYSLSLSENSGRSQILNLDDPDLKPEGWDSLQKPDLGAPEDTSIYELHPRDFSINDETVSPENRGRFTAFTEESSDGMNHLRSLADAGLSTVHLLPTNDMATVNEDASEREEPPRSELEAAPPDSERQQEIVGQYRDNDGFNWGYDPYHYTVPEGSYSTDPNGAQRVLEYREMVQATNESGLRMVMDVVYNHTSASGQEERSVLDKIVPGYYHRLDGNGDVQTSSCCPNTATEHDMMEKLMVDSVRTWAEDYKVDGFRYDLMGHHMKRNILAVREELDSLNESENGVDGEEIYVYGEGWDFGEVAGGARGVNATQQNMAGTGIGTFNDRVRDAARGGGPSETDEGIKTQGYLTGLFTDPNDLGQSSIQEQRNDLLLSQDLIRVSLAGNLSGYELTDRNGERVTGSEVDYNGSPAGYTEDPQEAVNYVAAHDNKTLFDAIQAKAPDDASVQERVRMQNLGTSLVTLSQGVPFLHAGQDMLRSKSMDRNSFDSGDWFNDLDFTYESNNWGVGLPPEWENAESWGAHRELLGNPELKPVRGDIVDARDHAREMFEIRDSTGLFRLETAAEVQQRVEFLNTGFGQEPGVIAMQITGGPGDEYQRIVTVFNTDDQEKNLTEDSLAGTSLSLHPVQQNSADPVVRRSSFDSSSGTLTVPARSTAVFVQE